MGWNGISMGWKSNSMGWKSNSIGWIGRGKACTGCRNPCLTHFSAPKRAEKDCRNFSDF